MSFFVSKKLLAEIDLLTNQSRRCKLAFPINRGFTVTLPCPTWRKLRLFSFLPTIAFMRVNIGGVTSGIREDRRLLLSRGALSRLFCFKTL